MAGQVAGDLILARRPHALATPGELHAALGPDLLCHTLELPWRDNERGKSCIPAGRWPLRLRGEGGFYERYTARWDWHRDMIEVVVPGRTFILFHVGNTIADTDGCILVGERPGVDEFGRPAVWSSRAAYERIYPIIHKRASEGGYLEVVHP